MPVMRSLFAVPAVAPSIRSIACFAGPLLLLACAVNVLVAWISAGAYFLVDPRSSSKTGGWDWKTHIVGPLEDVDNFGDVDSPYSENWSWVRLTRSSLSLPVFVEESVVAFVPEDYFDISAEYVLSVQRMPRSIRSSLAEDLVESEEELDEHITMWRDAVFRAGVYWQSEDQRRAFYEKNENRLRREYEIGRLDRARYKNYWVLQCGFPFASFASVHSQYAGGEATSIRPESGIPIGQPVEMPLGTVFHINNMSPEPLFVQPAIPTRFLWPGFMANTAVNSVALCGLWFVCKAGVGFFKRRRGRKRLGQGQCPNCRYSIRDFETCSECGWPLPVRAEMHEH